MTMTASFEDSTWREATLAIGREAGVSLDLELLGRYRFDPRLFLELRGQLGKGTQLEPVCVESMAAIGVEFDLGKHA